MVEVKKWAIPLTLKAIGSEYQRHIMVLSAEDSPWSWALSVKDSPRLPSHCWQISIKQLPLSPE